MGRASLYFHTVKNMKAVQVANRLRIMAGRGCSLGAAPSGNTTDIRRLACPDSLNTDPAFLARFPVDELMEDTVTILHSSKKMDWKRTWEFDDKSALWNFNLHYFEYLLPLGNEWKQTGDRRFLDKAIEMISGWIDANPKGVVPAWASYTTALRIVTWISWYGNVGEAAGGAFRKKFLSSLHDQYSFLSGHLEKDILGNHYFEDLKSLVLAAIFFKDEAVLEKALSDLKAECREEILSDGMHFELSPMYHKLILEGMLRVAAALRGAGRRDAGIESYLQPMLDAAYSLEDELERVPLFNDGGNNVSKSLGALVKAAGELGFRPRFKGQLKSGGFYIFRKNAGGKRWKLIVDAGQPGPRYIPGHAHCDAMSFELFCNGKPVIVNCGTYAYQCAERSFFRSTGAHNTVMADGTEQSQCWGVFRLAKRSGTKVLDVTDDSITMEMTDQKGVRIRRTISFSDELVITDMSRGKNLDSYLHFLEKPEVRDGVLYCDGLKLSSGGAEPKITRHPYAEDYGKKGEAYALVFTGAGEITVRLVLSSAAERTLPADLIP